MNNTDTAIQEGLISVLMCTYNTNQIFLKEAIDSVLNQTYSNFEFIIVDDGSANQSFEFIQTYTDPRIKLLQNQKNMGLTYSLNEGLDLCRGEYIARMDADDICFPDRFEKQFAYMRTHPDTIVCGTWAEYIDENDRLTGKKVCWKINDMEAYRIHLLFANRPTIFHSSSMINRRIMLEHNIRYNTEYRYAQDFRMWVSCSEYGICTNYPEILLKFRVHPNSIGQSRFEERLIYDYGIIQEQLDRLHLVLPDELKPVHFRLLTEYKRKPYSKELAKWLNTIIQANKKYKVYNQRKLNYMLRTCLIKIFFRSMARPVLGPVKRKLRAIIRKK